MTHSSKKPQQLTTTIHVEKRAEEFFLRLTITNVSQKTWLIPRKAALFGGLDEGKMQHKVITLTTLNGARDVAYTGYQRLQPPPGLAGHAQLVPGASITCEVNLSRNFDLSSARGLIRARYQSYATDDPGALGFDIVDSHLIEIESNVVEFLHS